MRAACPTHLVVDFNCSSVQVMKLLIMQSSLASRHFLPLRSKYSPQHPVLRHPQAMRDQVSHPYKRRGSSYVVILFAGLTVFVTLGDLTKMLLSDFSNKTFPCQQPAHDAKCCIINIY
jgi:hypothetical protein